MTDQPNPPWDSARVAAELGKSLDWFRRNWRSLVRLKKFPAPIDGLGQPRWHGPNVVAWLAGDYPPRVTFELTLPTGLEREAEERGRQIATH